MLCACCRDELVWCRVRVCHKHVVSDCSCGLTCARRSALVAAAARNEPGQPMLPVNQYFSSVENKTYIFLFIFNAVNKNFLMFLKIFFMFSECYVL